MMYYKINLSSLAPYFFGNELGSQLGNRQDYYQESAFIPQQTTLLGMLRHVLLLKHGKAVPVVNHNTGPEPQHLIGSKGFQNNSGVVNDYGIIKALSPLFFQKGFSGHYFLHRKRWQNNHNFTIEPTRHLDKLMVNQNGKLIPFTGKDEFTTKLIDLENESQQIDWESITGSHLMTGNTKSWEGEADDKSYYRHHYRELKTTGKTLENSRGTCFYHPVLSQNDEPRNRWSFAFYVALAEEDLISPGEETDQRMVIMGREQSMFQLNISSAGHQKPTIWQQFEEQVEGFDSSKIYRVTFLSDAFLGGDGNELFESHPKNPSRHLPLIDTIRFRSFAHPYSRQMNYAAKPIKSALHHLIQRGSIVYSNNPQELIDRLIRQKDFRQVGYNYFKIDTI